MTITTIQPKLLIYQAANGSIQLKADADNETIRANQIEMSQIFWVNIPAISKHIKNIYKENELNQKATVSKMEIVQNESGRKVKRKIVYYNLDVLIAVGYRINSITGTKFRQRATTTLKQHITQWFTINKKQLARNYDKFFQAVEDVKKLAHDKNIGSDEILELIKTFGQTWFSLDAFDKQTFDTTKQTAKKVKLESKKLYDDVLTLKQQLIAQKQTTELFAQEKEAGVFEGIFGNIMQTAFGKDVYPSIESKAAHLLYFVIKNHPFTDGNKRSGAFSFIRFLQKVGYDFRGKITPEALTAMALLIATSDPKDKERIIDLVILLLSNK